MRLGVLAFGAALGLALALAFGLPTTASLSTLAGSAWTISNSEAGRAC
ncbi:hypothetical protein PFLuk1_00008 [Pseudomonas fluorescens]|nr:hypothetical protein PFLuk1_00008 [Pseudomonas fluorescens]